MNFDRRIILIGGTEYAGENKKSVFSLLLNYLLPEKGMYADALLGQSRPWQPCGHRGFLWAFGHGQNHAFSGPSAPS